MAAETLSTFLELKRRQLHALLGGGLALRRRTLSLHNTSEPEPVENQPGVNASASVSQSESRKLQVGCHNTGGK